MSDPIRIQDWEPGEIRQLGRKAYGLCADCGRLVRIDKPVLGSLHLCNPGEEGS